MCLVSTLHVHWRFLDFFTLLEAQSLILHHDALRHVHITLKGLLRHQESWLGLHSRHNWCRRGLDTTGAIFDRSTCLRGPQSLIDLSLLLLDLHRESLVIDLELLDLLLC